MTTLDKLEQIFILIAYGIGTLFAIGIWNLARLAIIARLGT